MIINNPQYKPFTDEDMIVYKGAYSTNPVKTPPITDYDMLREYSEEPDKLMELLSQMEISIADKGVRTGYFDEKDASRRVVEVSIKRGSVEVEFDFGLSIKDTDDWSNRKEKKKIVGGMLYSILACCSCDYYIPNSLREFCEEFGYPYRDTAIASEPSESIFIRCKEQQAKLEKIFSEDEISCLPQ